MDGTALFSPTPVGSAPRRFRGPFARWPRAADGVLATVVFLGTVFVTDGPGDSLVIRPIGDVPIPALLVFAAASAALYWRRRAPLAVLAVVLVAWASTIGSGYADLGGVAIIALYSAGRYATNDRWGLPRRRRRHLRGHPRQPHRPGPVGGGHLRCRHHVRGLVRRTSRAAPRAARRPAGGGSRPPRPAGS